jgi:tetratricopeptide (TPR) repeat protein
MRGLVIVGLLCAWGGAQAGNVEKAKEHYENGLGAYALGRYDVAAQEYEQAFALKPDPALLYNAAQAHRLAGNKPRALLLYQNLLRLFGGKLSNKDEVQRHITALGEAIASEARATHAPPTEPQPVKPEPAPPPEAPRAEPAPRAEARPMPTVTAAPPPRKKTPGWVWGVVGGSIAVVVGAGIGLGLGLGLPPADPTASFGVARVR